MEVYFQLIKDAETLRNACEQLKEKDYLGFDTETTSLDPYEGVIRLVQLSDGTDTKVIDLLPFSEKGDIKTLPELAPLRELPHQNPSKSRTTPNLTRNGLNIISESKSAEFSTRFSPVN